MLQLYAVRQKKDNPGHLSSCLSCGANGRAMFSTCREPARPVRATNVADVLGAALCVVVVVFANVLALKSAREMDLARDAWRLMASDGKR